MRHVIIGVGGEFATVGEALAAVPVEEPLTIRLGEGVFLEKIHVSRPGLRLIGAGMDRTILVWNDGAFDPHPDGRPTGTFRSQTAFFDGDWLEVQDLTIENLACDGERRGQAIAAAVYTRMVRMERVRLLSGQDTLFLGPLPPKERQKDGFLGPRQNAPRISSQQSYEACEIFGDIDFIFGGGDAVFSHCKIHAVGERSGFLAAPSTTPEGLGFVFIQCTVMADRPGTLRLARPWRETGKAAFLHCDFTDAVSPVGFDPWEERETQRFVFREYPPGPAERQYAQTLTQKEADQLRCQAEEQQQYIAQYIQQQQEEN